MKVLISTTDYELTIEKSHSRYRNDEDDEKMTFDLEEAESLLAQLLVQVPNFRKKAIARAEKEVHEAHQKLERLKGWNTVAKAQS